MEYYTGKLPKKGILPKDIPTNPHNIYKDKGWINYEDWLGYDTKTLFKDFWRQRYRSFEEARSFVRRLGLKSESEWIKYCRGKLPEKGKKPDDIPTKAYRTYKEDGWISMGDWLGTGTVATKRRKYLPFKEARAFVHSIGLKSQSEWIKYCRGELPEKGIKPNDIPTKAYRTYKDKGWVSMGDWLGKIE